MEGQEIVLMPFTRHSTEMTTVHKKFYSYEKPNSCGIQSRKIISRFI